MVLWTHPNPQHKWHLDQLRRFCTVDHRVSLYFTMGRPFSPQNCPFPNCISIGSAIYRYAGPPNMVKLYSSGGANVHPHLMHPSLGPPDSTNKMPTRMVQPFLHNSQQCSWAYPAMSFPLKNAPSLGAIWIHI